MATRKKTNETTIKVKESNKALLIVLGLLLLFLYALRFEPVLKATSNVTGLPPEQILRASQNYKKILLGIVMIGIGSLLLGTGIAGAIFITVGVVILGSMLFPTSGIPVSGKSM